MLLSILAMRHKILIGCVVFIVLISLQLHIGNAGGSGKNLPQVFIGWGILCLFALGILWRTRRTSMVVTPISVVIFAATLILWIPLLFTRDEWRLEALWPLLGLSAGIVFYFSMLQVKWSPALLQRLMLFIIAASLLQTLVVLWQYFLPGTLPGWLAYPYDKDRPAGVFQQVNLLASFTATGLISALLLFVTRRKGRLRDSGYIYLYILSAALVLLPFLLVILQSRIGWVGSGFAIFPVLLFAMYKEPRRITAPASLMLCGILLGIACIWGDVSAQISHEGSNHARIIMLRETLSMIFSRPWLGWGYGGYEYSFQHFRLWQGESTLGLGVVTHPHNEYLYRWVEGGFLGLVGVLLFTLCGVGLAWLTCQRIKRTSTLTVSLRLASPGLCLLPLTLHTQTEYPFYISSLLWGTFLLFLAAWDSLATPKYLLLKLSVLRGGAIRGALSSIMFAALLFTVSGGYSGWLLWRFEQQQFRGPHPDWQVNPWLLSERARFDEQTASLLAFNHDGDKQRLEYYVLWARNYSGIHIDREVYARLLQILRAQKLSVASDYWGKEAHALFPDDPRFQFYSGER
ncbi:Wzy polymerase domain-containing protein [Enterobacter asburiae]|uniref:PglL family O-oligosaccharyltransferase n=1 Tax=Scandinavium sp. UTDF21-P1B TaxID=3446379 RepID=UPI003475FE91